MYVIATIVFFQADSSFDYMNIWYVELYAQLIRITSTPDLHLVS